MENEELSIEDIGHSESIINPDLWSYSAVSKAIEAMGTGENLKISFEKFRALINIAEAVLRGQNRLSEESYDQPLEEFKKGEKYKKLESSEARGLAESTKKLELLAQSIGETGIIKNPLKLGKGGYS